MKDHKKVLSQQHMSSPVCRSTLYLKFEMHVS